MENISGQETAFKTVFEHRTKLLASVRTILLDSHWAEDVVSEAMLEIVRSWPQYDQTRPFEPWARGIARNFARAALRRQEETCPLNEAVIDKIGETFDPHHESEFNLRKEALYLCMAKLSDRNKELVESVYFENQSRVHISNLVKKTVSALESLLGRLRLKLYHCILNESRFL